MKLFLVIFGVAALLAGAAIYTNLNRPAVAIVEMPTTVSQLGAPTTSANEAYGFSIERRDKVAMRTSGFEGYVSRESVPIVGLVLPSEMFVGTNLVEAGVYVGVATTSGALENCGKPDLQAGEEFAGSARIGGQDWGVFTSTGAAAGNQYEKKTYRVSRGGMCYEIVELLHSGTIGNYPPGVANEFDRAAFSTLLDSITRTFVFTSGLLKP